MDRDLEQQLQELQKQFAGLAKTLGSSSKTVLKNTRDNRTFANVQKMLSKSMDDYLKRVKKGDGIFHEFSDAIEAAKKDVKGFSRILQSVPSPMGLVVKGLTFLKDAVIGTGVAMAKTALALSDTTATIQSLEDLVDKGFGELPYAGKLMKEFSREIDSNVEAFTQLAKSGATFGSSIVMLRKAQADALMPLSKFTDLIGKNSVTLARLFGTVDQGVPQIAGLMDRLGRMTMDEFGKFGLTLDDTSEYLSTFLELERARGNTTRMSQSQLLQGTREYTKNLVTLSKLTGESVDQLNEQNMAMAADGVFQSQLTKMNAEDAKTLSLGISALPGPLQQFAKEMIGLGAPIGETSRELQAISGGRLGDAILQFQRDLDPVAFQNAMKTISGDVMRNAEAFGQAALAGGGFGEALNAIVTQIGEAVDPETLRQEIQARGDNIVELRNLQTQTDRLKSAFETTRFALLKEFIYDENSIVNVGGFLNEQFEKMAKEGLPKLQTAINNFYRLTRGEDVEGMDPDNQVTKSWFNRWLSETAAPGTAGDIAGEASMFNFNEGSKGFRNFGTGTPAMLHGVEAVVPKNDIGQLSDLLTNLGSTTTNNTTAGDMITNNNTAMDMTILNNNTSELIELNKKVERHLNTLITIGAMTEKNTKNTTNSLANMGDSLV